MAAPSLPSTAEDRSRDDGKQKKMSAELLACFSCASLVSARCVAGARSPESSAWPAAESRALPDVARRPANDVDDPPFNDDRPKPTRRPA